jgi:hypothetical protein
VYLILKIIETTPDKAPELGLEMLWPVPVSASCERVEPPRTSGREGLTGMLAPSAMM